MLNVRAKAHRNFVIGPVRPRTFGSFAEHLGRCIYTGIYEPEHPTADTDGFREDVIELVRELGVTSVRYPGGNFVSGYRWEDGIGPVDDRPRRLDLAWHSTEPNWVGIDEFMRWCKKTGVEPMMAVNLGTRGVQEALELLEYCNVPGGTYFSDLRRKNGAEEPYRIKMWCLGNEMDGEWQIGNKTAEEYSRLAAVTARAMRMIDPTIELIACGSTKPIMPTFGEWERVVLAETYDQVDMISAHSYFFDGDDFVIEGVAADREFDGDHDAPDLDSFVASAVGMDRFIAAVVATIDAAKAAGKHEKDVHVSFDEWNVWYKNRAASKPPTGDDWPVAPVLLEDRYNVADAVVVGNLLMSLLRNTDRVHSASQAQLVNVIAPIMTEPTEEGGRAWKQTIFHPFALTAAHAKGVVLRSAIDSPTVATKRYGEVTAADVVTTFDPETGESVVFAVNRSTTDAIALEVEFSGFADLEVAEALTYSHEDPMWQATKEDSTSVSPHVNESVKSIPGQVVGDLPPISWTMIRLHPA